MLCGAFPCFCGVAESEAEHGGERGEHDRGTPACEKAALFRGQERKIGANWHQALLIAWEGIGDQLADSKLNIGGPDRDRTDDLFHAIVPTVGFSTTYKTPVAP